MRTSRPLTSPPPHPTLSAATVGQLAAEHAPDGLLVVDLQRTCRWANPAALMLACAPTLVGQPLRSILAGFLTPEAAEQVRQAVQAAFGSGAQPSLRALPLINHDRGAWTQQRYCTCQVTRLDQDGQPLALLSWTEVSEQVRAQEGLHQQRRELEQFVHIASHDLREPLRMINSFLRLLETRCAEHLSEQGTQYLHFATDGGRRLSAMLDALLAFARVGTRGDCAATADADACARQALDHLHDRVQARAAEIAIEPLPRVRGDADLLTTLFQQLLANALTFTLPGAPPPHVAVSAERQGPCWTFTIRDDGPGIPAAECERVFQLFQRLGTPAAPELPSVSGNPLATGTGTGMGLTICRKIVERHGGRIWIDGVPPHGTAVHFTLLAA